MTALDLLRASRSPAGFLASPTERTNYRRVWARDGVICGLAGLASGEDDLADGLRDTLETLAAHLGPQGQIPSNVPVGEGGAVSYGGLAGRVDAGPWFVLGVALYARVTGDRAFADRMAGPVAGALRLLDAWEFNARGLVYVPQSGDWADEYDLHGYLLYDQVLRLAALRAWAPLASNESATRRQAARLHALIEATFWPREGDLDAGYHPAAARTLLDDGDAEHPLAALTPGGYVRRFDALGSALALALTDLWADRADALADHALGLASETAPGLVPAFAPVVREGDPGWETLLGNTRDTFSNRPGHYHNGGCWPMVNGWWAAALARAGRQPEARALADRVDAANRHDFPEYLDAGEGEPHGTRPLAWSAAGAVLARHGLADGALFRGPDGHHPAPPEPSGEVDVVVAGEVLVDFISSEPAGDLGAAGAFERHAGGSPANLATNLARLGVPVALVSAVGADGLGRFLRREVEAVGVDARLVERPEAPTSVVAVARSVATPDFVVFRSADRLLRPAQLPDGLLGAARLFHTSGFALSAEPARTTLLDAAARARSLGTALSIDINFAPRTERERAAHQDAARRYLALGPLVKCSSDDVERLRGGAVSDDDVLAWLHGLGADLVCLTRGPDGALVSWAGGAESAEVPAEPVEVVRDATGAGDAFWSGFLAAWLDGAAPPDCAQAGGRMAALKLGRVGPLPARVEI